MILAAWMFDQIPWNPWVFWPPVVLFAIAAIGSIIRAMSLRMQREKWDLDGIDIAAGSMVIVAAVWTGMMALTNEILEEKAEARSARATREACFEIMNDYALNVPVEVESRPDAPAAMMRGFLSLPEYNSDVVPVRDAMAERGCQPLDLMEHLDDWEEEWEEEAERRAREKMDRAKLDSAGGPEAILRAIKP